MRLNRKYHSHHRNNSVSTAAFLLLFIVSPDAALSSFLCLLSILVTRFRFHLRQCTFLTNQRQGGFTNPCLNAISVGHRCAT
jgi:hypothetical protein